MVNKELEPTKKSSKPSVGELKSLDNSDCVCRVGTGMLLQWTIGSMLGVCKVAAVAERSVVPCVGVK